ncbi:hypothetical protein ACQP3L_33135, partial [Escherichia coli]
TLAVTHEAHSFNSAFLIVISNKFVKSYLPTGKVDINSKQIYKINYDINFFLPLSQNLSSTNLCFFN